jgi:predicted aminopeptidase
MRRFVVLLLVLSSPACTTMRYLSQAAHGQLLLMQDAEPIDDVLADPGTDDRTRRLLGEVPIVQAWAERRGLESKGNYRQFVQRKGAASVWYVTASAPLAFEPKVWSFPIVGSFPMLGWFALEDALEFRQQLKADGWEVYVRGAIAYSTGGWFRDPVISTMFLDVPGETGELVNVILHETVHANVLVRDQAYFNESLASFIADGMTAEYLAARFGRNSPELAIYRQDLTDSRARAEILTAGYQELDALYKSAHEDDYKLRRKQIIMKRLKVQAQLSVEPNNAMLLGFRTYNVGFSDLTQLLRACGGNWGRFIAQVKRLRPEDFPAPLAEDLGPALRPLVQKRCTR